MLCLLHDIQIYGATWHDRHPNAGAKHVTAERDWLTGMGQIALNDIKLYRDTLTHKTSESSPQYAIWLMFVSPVKEDLRDGIDFSGCDRLLLE